MKKNLNVLFLLLVVSVFIMACGLAGLGADEPAAPADPDTVEEPVAEAEPTPVPDMDLTDLVLTSQDFPDAAFANISLADMGMSEADLNSEEFTVESFFALLESTNFEMVMGFTTLLKSPLDRAGFDLVLNQPNILLDSFLGGMGDMSANDPEELPEFTDTVGDSSAGMTVVTDAEGMAMRIDMVVFRNDSIGAFLITMYLEGQTPPVPLMDVAKKFDGKIETFLASQ
jgi:hypothetical protein